MALRPPLCLKNGTFPDTKRSGEAHWSDLHRELLRLISQKLTDISDFVRLRVVCKRWRSAVGTSDLPPQLPWIIDGSERFGKGDLRFYSLLTGETYTFNVDRYHHEKCTIGSAYNYIPTCNWVTHEYSLFNPLTNEELSLPPTAMSTPRCVPSVQLLSPDQSSRYVCMTSAPTVGFTCLFFCQLGDLDWTSIQPVLFSDAGAEFSLNTGFALYDGMWYANDRDTGSTKVINLATRTVVCVVPRPETELGVHVCLVVSFGEILRVCQYEKNSTEKPCYFHLYRLELGNRKRDENMMHPCWIKIDNIRNQFLFLHEHHGCAFRADDFPGFVGNSIYFFQEKREERTIFFSRYDVKVSRRNVKLSRYDVKDGNIEVNEVLQVPEKLGHSWFVPSLCKQSSNYRS